MKLSIIIVSWNVKKDLLGCLQSIKQNPPHKDFEIIVIDNASIDETVRQIKTDFPRITLIANDKNRGFAAANNQGIEKSRGQYILFLNPDTIVQPGSLDSLINFLDDNKDAGACGPKLLNSDGTIQPSARCFPSFRGALYRHTAFGLLRIFRNEYKKWLMKDFGYDKITDVDQLMGSALLVRRSAIDKVGNMDESFFMYYEEVDLCYRIKQAGWRIVFVPDAVITHLGGQSSGQIPAKKRIIAIASLIVFFRKHRGKLTTGAFNCIFKPAVILQNLCDIIWGVVRYVLAVLTADKQRCRKAAAKIRVAAALLFRFWALLRI